MFSLKPVIGRRALFLGLALLMMIQLQTYGQSCSCPPIATCGCNVGLTKLTIQFTGLLSVTVSVEDNGGNIHSGLLLLPGSIFEIESSASAGQPFVGDVVRISGLLIGTTAINTSCAANQVKIGSDFGSFTVIAGESVGGVPICCEVMETTLPVISGCPADITVSSNPSDCGVNVNWTAPTVADNCAVSSFTASHNPGDFFPEGTTIVTYEAEDNYGNVSTCSFDVIVNDDTDPVISACPADIYITADASCEAVASWTAPTASDNCSVASFTSDHNPGETFSLGTTTVTYIATDGAGNISTCSFDIIVNDDTDPVITGCPTDIFVTADASCKAVVNWTAPMASDNCSVASFTSDHNPGETFPLGTTTVTYTATDGSGNIATCSFDVIVSDDTDPIITGCPVDINISADASCKAVANWTAPNASDNCSVASFASDHIPGETFPLGTTTVTYTATDGAGNIATCSFDVIVSDNTDPIISGCPADVYISANASCEAVVNWPAPTASDNCSVSSFTSDHNPGETFPLGTTTITYTATDGAGNIAICSFNVIVNDDTDPVISSCPADIYVFAYASCEAVANWTAPTASDNCSFVSLTGDHNPGEAFPLGTTTVTYTVTDGSGNIATCSFDVIVSDDTDPVIAGCPVDISVSADASCEAVVSWTAPTASDNCSVASFTSDHNPGETFSLGTTTVTYTATDGAGNVVTCSFDVIVSDDTNPIINGCPADIYVSADGSCEAIATWTPPTVSDKCSVASFTSDHNPGETFSPGTTTVTYTATDGAGNVVTCSFDVIVSDDTNPIISGCPADIYVSADGSCEAIANWTPPTVSDNCSVASFTSDHNPGETFLLGTTKVTYTATDGDGNIATCSFDVIVSDDIDPVITGCPSDVYVSAGASCEAAASWTPPTTEDCSLATLTSSHQPGAIFPIGSTEITYTATDNNENASSCKFNVIVEDDTPPLFQNCPTEISIAVDEACRAIAHWTIPTAIDNCQVVSLTSSHSPGDTFQAGITEVEYKATDSYGNISHCRFNVVVKDEEPPVISGCPADILVRAGEAGEVSVSWDPPTATAGCGSVTLTSSHEPGSLFAVGETLVEYKVIDESGNTTLCTFNVIVTFEDLTFEVVKVVTPDGDGINDEWILPNIEKFTNNNVVIVDRWGSVIYRASGYNNNTVVWKGVNSSGALVPTGTYFYVIKVDFSDKQVERSGFIELIR